jgi:hypothetical protein
MGHPSISQLFIHANYFRIGDNPPDPVNKRITMDAPTKHSSVRLMQVNRHSDSPDALVNQFHKN